MASSIRRRLNCLSVLILIASAFVTSAQVPDSTAGSNKPPAPVSEIPYVLHVSTREVLVDVIAVNSNDQPIEDLTPADLSVTEKLPHSQQIPETVSSLRLIDPIATDSGSLPGGGFRIAANESCLQSRSIHYQLTYHPGPQGMTSGDHQVLIRARLRGVHLFYRHSYFIGATAAPENPSPVSQSEIEKEIEIDACSHPVDPLSISLRAARIATGSADMVRYSASIESDSLAFVSFSENGRQLQLDYGACNFNAAGHPIGYMHASTDQVLTPLEYAHAQAHGFQRIFEFAPPQGIAMTRFVVRDRVTGNLGLADVTFPIPEGEPDDLDPTVLAILRKDLPREGPRPPMQIYHYVPPPPGPLGSFGSVVPSRNAFCGDVYELRPDTPRLPDFRDLDPIGSIYTYSLAVPNQIFLGTQGIPGVTDRTTWFGVDYRANFWIRNAGTYEFRMTSDDGAVLQIDDKRVIDLDDLHQAETKSGHIELDAGRHSMHIPYYEGTPYAVALSLWVRPPNEDWKIFDVRDFLDRDHQDHDKSEPMSFRNISVRELP